MLDNEQVCRSAAVALGYLSFNGSGAREMLMICRNTPGLYSALEQNLGSGKMSMEFVDSWRRAVNVGLPSKRLESMPHFFFCRHKQHVYAQYTANSKKVVLCKP